MAETRYHQFCPVAMSAEILCTRWTVLVLREMLAGSTRFNEFRRGLPRMSPALLSRRLKELEDCGIIARTRTQEGSDLYEYVLTEAGRDLERVISAIGGWGQTWIDAKASLDNANLDYLMTDMQRRIDPKVAPRDAFCAQIIYRDQPDARRKWWIVVEPDQHVDVCSFDPGREVDLYVATDLRTMTAIWMGLDKMRDRIEDSSVIVSGERDLEVTISAWLGLSVVAPIPKRGGVLIA